MTHPNSPGSLCAAFDAKLADTTEPVVGNEARLLPKIDANAMRVFVKFDSPAIDSIFSYRAMAASQAWPGASPHGYRRGKTCPRRRQARRAGKTNFTMPGETARDFVRAATRARRRPPALAFV
jgi:hypothetical protein